MSCIFCNFYQGIDCECKKGVKVENTYESFDCEHYSYNQGLNVIE